MDISTRVIYAPTTSKLREILGPTAPINMTDLELLEWADKRRKLHQLLKELQERQMSILQTPVLNSANLVEFERALDMNFSAMTIIVPQTAAVKFVPWQEAVMANDRARQPNFPQILLPEVRLALASVHRQMLQTQVVFKPLQPESQCLRHGKQLLEATQIAQFASGSTTQQVQSVQKKLIERLSGLSSIKSLFGLLDTTEYFQNVHFSDLERLVVSNIAALQINDSFVKVATIIAKFILVGAEFGFLADSPAGQVPNSFETKSKKDAIVTGLTPSITLNNEQAAGFAVENRGKTANFELFGGNCVVSLQWSAGAERALAAAGGKKAK